MQTARMIRFGKTFEAEKLPAQYTLQVCADSRYILRVNGTTVSRGPCRHKDRYRYADTVDIAPYLRRGENRIEADVIHYGDGMLQKNDLSGVPVSVEHTTLGGLLVMDGGELELSSNQSWSCSHRSGYHFVMRYPWLAYIGYNEEVDFRVQDSWKPAEIQCSSASYTSGGLAGVWILEPRPVPQPYESGRRFPAVLCGTPGIDWTAWLGDGEPLTIPPHTQAEVWLDPGEYETAFRGRRPPAGGMPCLPCPTPKNTIRRRSAGCGRGSVRPTSGTIRISLTARCGGLPRFTTARSASAVSR